MFSDKIEFLKNDFAMWEGAGKAAGIERGRAALAGRSPTVESVERSGAHARSVLHRHRASPSPVADARRAPPAAHNSTRPAHTHICRDVARASD